MITVGFFEARSRWSEFVARARARRKDRHHTPCRADRTPDASSSPGSAGPGAHLGGADPQEPHRADPGRWDRHPGHDRGGPALMVEPLSTGPVWAGWFIDAEQATQHDAPAMPAKP